MRILLLALSLLLSLHASAADYTREQKWADEILPAVLVGDPVWLSQSDGHKVLGLYTPSSPAKGGVILVHGIGVHPDWGLIGALRQQLADAGYSTLSLQMPVLKAEATADDYPPTFPLAGERLALAVEFLKAKGISRIAIVSHSLGSRMSHHYLAGQPDAAVNAWVAIGAPAPLDMAGLRLAVLDLYGQNDLPQVVNNGGSRAKGLKQPGSTQIVVPGADHFFEGKEAKLFEEVRGFLDRVLR